MARAVNRQAHVELPKEERAEIVEYLKQKHNDKNFLSVLGVTDIYRFATVDTALDSLFENKSRLKDILNDQGKRALAEEILNTFATVYPFTIYGFLMTAYADAKDRSVDPSQDNPLMKRFSLKKEFESKVNNVHNMEDIKVALAQLHSFSKEEHDLFKLFLNKQQAALDEQGHNEKMKELFAYIATKKYEGEAWFYLWKEMYEAYHKSSYDADKAKYFKK